MKATEWIQACAPLYINCQQQDIFKIRDKVPGCGPRRVVMFGEDGGEVLLECGHSLSLSYMPIWESTACAILRERAKAATGDSD